MQKGQYVHFVGMGFSIPAGSTGFETSQIFRNAVARVRYWKQEILRIR